MSKFILKKDWSLKGEILGKSYQELLYTKGQIFEPNSAGEYVVKTSRGEMILKYDEIKSATDQGELLFQETTDKLTDITVSVLDADFDDVQRNYRLQLDVKTTGKKAKQIENFLRKTLEEML